MALPDAVLNQAAESLSLASEILRNLEVAVTLAEMTRGIISGQDAAAIANSATAELEQRLAEIVEYIAISGTEITASFLALDAAVATATAVITRKMSEITVALIQAPVCWGEMSDAFGESSERIVSGVEGALESMEDKLGSDGAEFTERLSAAADCTSEALGESIESLRSAAEASGEAAVRFTDVVGGRIGDVIDVLDQIGDVIEPIHPVLLVMESVA